MGTVNEWRKWPGGGPPQLGRAIAMRAPDGREERIEKYQGKGLAAFANRCSSERIEWRYADESASAPSELTPEPGDEMKKDGGKPPLELIPWEVADRDGEEVSPIELSECIIDYLRGGGIKCLIDAHATCLRELSRPSELDWPGYIEAAHVLAFGAKKYAPDKWREGGTLTQTRVLGAALRHIAAWRMGETKDEETGRHPLAHALCEIWFAMVFAHEGRQDDRVKRSEPRPACVPEGRPWTYATDGWGQRVAIWLAPEDGPDEDLVCIEDPLDPGYPWSWIGPDDPDFHGDGGSLTPALSDQCQAFYDSHRS